jgi:hypothetical protein
MRQFVMEGKVIYVRCVGASQRPQFQWLGDRAWFAASPQMWEQFSADALRTIAEAKEAGR